MLDRKLLKTRAKEAFKANYWRCVIVALIMAIIMIYNHRGNIKRLMNHEENKLDLSKLSTFELSSEDLHDGVWDTVITKTANGENRSPQLSWKPVDGASCYAVFMIDTSAGNWLHWKSVTDSETVLPAGWAPQSEYVGPYPPSGTHDYEIYVLALKEKPERIKGSFDNSNPKMLEYAKDIDGENEDNIISYGHLMGTYTHGD